jgi:hypothetical protein
MYMRKQMFNFVFIIILVFFYVYYFGFYFVKTWGPLGPHVSFKGGGVKNPLYISW